MGKKIVGKDVTVACKSGKQLKIIFTIGSHSSIYICIRLKKDEQYCSYRKYSQTTKARLIRMCKKTYLDLCAKCLQGNDYLDTLTPISNEN